LCFQAITMQGDELEAHRGKPFRHDRTRKRRGMIKGTDDHCDAERQAIADVRGAGMSSAGMHRSM
jgi:hypothetical protein